MMAWLKTFKQRAGKGGTDHQHQGSARKLSDNLNVRNKGGKESGVTGRPGAWGRQLLRGQEKRGEGALPPEPKLLLRRQTVTHLQLGPARAGRYEGCPWRGISGVVEMEIFFFLILTNFVAKMAKLNMSKGSAYYVFLAQPSPAHGKLFFPISFTALCVPVNSQGQC